MSVGPCLSAARQRAASTSSAVESGPPDTAITRAPAERRSSNRVLASAAETGSASSAADTLLFPVDALLHADRRARIFAQDLAERCTGGLLLAHGGERLAEPEQRVGRLCGGVVPGRHVEKGFGGIAVALPLEQALAQPILRIGREPVARIAAKETSETLFGERVVLAQDVAVGEVVGVLWAVGGRQRRDLAAGPVRIARLRKLTPRRRHAGAERRISGGRTRERREIERSASRASAWSSDLLVLRERCARAGRAECPGRAGRVRIERRIECIATPSRRRSRRQRRRWQRCRRLLRPRLLCWRLLRGRLLCRRQGRRR